MNRLKKSLLRFVGFARSSGWSNVVSKRDREVAHEREAALKADDGWLSVSGLFWLKEGRQPSEPTRPRLISHCRKILRLRESARWNSQMVSLR
jgi:hypothetical protein